MAGENDAVLQNLLDAFPDFDKDLLRDILSGCEGEFDSAFAILCDMVVHDTVAGPSSLSHDGPLRIQMPCSATAQTVGHNTTGGDDMFDDVFAEAFSRLDVASDSVLGGRSEPEEEEAPLAKCVQRNDEAIPGESRAAAASSNVVMGSWVPPSVGDGVLSKAGQLCVDRIAAKFCWNDKADIARLYVASGGSEELTEELLAAFYPESTRIAYNPDGPALRNGQSQYFSAISNIGREQNLPTPASAVGSLMSGMVQTSDVTEMERIAAERRARDVAEIAAASASAAGVSTGRNLSPDDNRQYLLGLLAENTTQRDAAQTMYIKTRRTLHSQDARRLGDEVTRTWRQLLSAICSSPDFEAGRVDLHGLNASQAVQVVDAKLAQRGGGRAKFITGRGNNSTGRRAVLLPVIENHLTELGIVFSRDDTGGALVARLP
jgi:CUE domain